MQIRTIIGIMFILGGIFFFGITATILIQALSRQTELQSVRTQLETSCRDQVVRMLSTLNSAQYPATIKPRENNGYEIDMGDASRDPRSMLSDITAILAMCPTRTLQDVCLGVTCVGSTPTIVPRMIVRLSPPISR